MSPSHRCDHISSALERCRVRVFTFRCRIYIFHFCGRHISVVRLWAHGFEHDESSGWVFSV
ncbi:unnamed protein product [Brassica oleracea var. botrytis]